MVAKTAPEKMWTTEELAAYLDVPVATVRRWRYMGTGPRGARCGRHVRYHPEQVRRWLEEQQRDD